MLVNTFNDEGKQYRREKNDTAERSTEILEDATTLDADPFQSQWPDQGRVRRSAIEIVLLAQASEHP
jgi:hypothetical protein